eukprot:3632416-Prymnesium_polylepis.1
MHPPPGSLQSEIGRSDVSWIGVAATGSIQRFNPSRRPSGSISGGWTDPRPVGLIQGRTLRNTPNGFRLVRHYGMHNTEHIDHKIHARCNPVPAMERDALTCVLIGKLFASVLGTPREAHSSHAGTTHLDDVSPNERLTLSPFELMLPPSPVAVRAGESVPVTESRRMLLASWKIRAATQGAGFAIVRSVTNHATPAVATARVSLTSGGGWNSEQHSRSRPRYPSSWHFAAACGCRGAGTPGCYLAAAAAVKGHETAAGRTFVPARALSLSRLPKPQDSRLVHSLSRVPKPQDPWLVHKRGTEAVQTLELQPEAQGADATVRGV